MLGSVWKAFRCRYYETITFQDVIQTCPLTTKEVVIIMTPSLTVIRHAFLSRQMLFTKQ